MMVAVDWPESALEGYLKAVLQYWDFEPFGCFYFIADGKFII